jgi:hypothetical protein
MAELVGEMERERERGEGEGCSGRERPVLGGMERYKRRQDRQQKTCPDWSRHQLT